MYFIINSSELCCKTAVFLGSPHIKGNVFKTNILLLLLLAVHLPPIADLLCFVGLVLHSCNLSIVS